MAADFPRVFADFRGRAPCTLARAWADVMATAAQISRLARRRDAFMVPRPVSEAPGLFVVDATWGRIMPMTVAPCVRTVGELELMAHVAAGLPLVDTRLRRYIEGGMLPSARWLAHTDLPERAGELDRTVDTILYCNGPQCAATPDAIRVLLDAGHPAERLLYYRGGIHDWLTLGLPLVPAR
jgi:rhodanese-related sulfurtransferase